MHRLFTNPCIDALPICPPELNDPLGVAANTVKLCVGAHIEEVLGAATVACGAGSFSGVFYYATVIDEFLQLVVTAFGRTSNGTEQ